MNSPTGVLPRTLLIASLLVAVAACDTTTTPTVEASATIAPTDAIAPTGAGAACSSTDLGLTSGAWGAAAGSRGTDVSVENHGAAACTLPPGPSVAIVDNAGTVLLESPPVAGNPAPSLEPGGIATFTVLFSNWCAEGTALPLRVVLETDTVSIPVPGLEMTAEDLPPCNGPGQPPSLSVNPWQPLE